MFKKFLMAAALLITSPAIVSAEDIFWSFDSASNVTTTTGEVGTSGTAYIFSDHPFRLDALDLNFTSSDSSVLLLTGGTAVTPTFNTIGGTAFNSSVVTIDAAGGDGSLFAVNATQNGINPALSALFNPAWEAGAGSAGAVRLAVVDYTVVSAGNATLSFSLGPQGALYYPDIILDPSFGTATLVGEASNVPEPSALALLVLGSAGLVARRRRA